MTENKRKMPLILEAMQLLYDARQDPFDARSIADICVISYNYVVKELAANKENYRKLSMANNPLEKYHYLAVYMKEEYFENIIKDMEWYDINPKISSRMVKEKFGFNSHFLSSEQIGMLIDADIKLKCKANLHAELDHDIEENWHSLWKELRPSYPGTLNEIRASGITQINK